MPQSPRSFPLSAHVHGQDLCFIGTDVICGWFFAGCPDDLPTSACSQKGSPRSRLELTRRHDAWKAAVLTRGVYAEREGAWGLLSPELVQRLGGVDEGSAGDALVRGYFSALGWITPADPGYLDCDLPMPEGAVLDPPPVTAEQRRAMVHMPGKNTLGIVADIANRCSTSAHRVWRSWMASQFIFEFRARLTPELTADKARKAPAAGLTPEMQRVGVGNG